MNFSREIEVFINDFVKDLNENSASIFAGAGLSIPAGFVNWSELMYEIAQDLGLDISIEKDMLSVAQFHVNESQTRSKLNRKILEEFTNETSETENHKIIARLPISSIWTTNYDNLIEKSFLKTGKVVDVKITNRQLLITKPKRDIVVFKMHGDVNYPNEAILTKEQYEQYHQTHEPFINTLMGELITKTFLFIGFSFTDPNLDYVLSRLNFRFREDKRQHYCFVKKPHLGDPQNPNDATLDYNSRRLSLSINDLKRYGIKSLIINEYSEITSILAEIEQRYKKRTIFISGSAVDYSPMSKNDAIEFIHVLSRSLIENDYRIVNGFGSGVGTPIINGVLDAMHKNPTRFSDNQLLLKPFPQFSSGGKTITDIWEEYRYNMVAQCGVSIFLFGNKISENGLKESDGVFSEFEISAKCGNICIPIGMTGSAAKAIYETIMLAPQKYYENPDIIIPALKELNTIQHSIEGTISIIISLLKKL
ncbi:MAG: SIR2 family protein [Bacteroidetes bacterium]|nr:SIR2 family protein [Bacteroidota bacterium]